MPQRSKVGFLKITSPIATALIQGRRTPRRTPLAANPASARVRSSNHQVSESASVRWRSSLATQDLQTQRQYVPEVPRLQSSHRAGSDLTTEALRHCCGPIMQPQRVGGGWSRAAASSTVSSIIFKTSCAQRAATAAAGSAADVDAAADHDSEAAAGSKCTAEGSGTKFIIATGCGAY